MLTTTFQWISFKILNDCISKTMNKVLEYFLLLTFDNEVFIEFKNAMGSVGVCLEDVMIALQNNDFVALQDAMKHNNIEK